MIDNIEEQLEDQLNNDVLVVNIRWSSQYSINNNKKKAKDLPDVFSFSIPKGLRELENTNEAQFIDAIESFAYNFLSKKFGMEVNFCQVYLPLKTIA